MNAIGAFWLSAWRSRWSLLRSLTWKWGLALLIVYGMRWLIFG